MKVNKTQNLSSNEATFQLLTQREVEAFDAELHQFITTGEAGIYEMLGFHLGFQPVAGGASAPQLPMRTVAQAVLATARAFGAPPEEFLTEAAAMELLHQSFEIHADVQNGSTERGGRPSVWWQYGAAQAINSGDLMNVLSRKLLTDRSATGADLDYERLRQFDLATLSICEGKYQELVLCETLATKLDDYFSVARAVRGQLIGCAVLLGAPADISAESAEAVREFGECIGVATKIKRDMEIIWSEPTADTYSQFAVKQKLLPVVYLFSEGDASSKRELAEIYAARVVEATKLPKIVELVNRAGARDYCEAELKRFTQAAELKLQQGGIDAAVSGNLKKVADDLLQFAGAF